MFVCHVCQSLPALTLSPGLQPTSLPVCPLWDGTRCPWCYYPRTLPGRAGGRFPPIILISNGQPGEREWVRERERKRPKQKGGFSPAEPSALTLSLLLSLSDSALDNQLLKSRGFILCLNAAKAKTWKLHTYCKQGKELYYRVCHILTQ